MKNEHATELDNDGTGDEEERAVCGDLEKVATVALLAPSTE